LSHFGRDAAPSTSSASGALVISLDFELYWGVRDKRSFEDYREHLLGVHEVVPRLLSLFSNYGIHATWAVVGMLLLDDYEELLRYRPERLPRYHRAELDPYSYADRTKWTPDLLPLHFAPGLVRAVHGTPHQEVGCHTFSHYYCLEEPEDLESFESDLVAAKRVSLEKLGVAIESLVFPRNQYSARHLAVAARHGILAVRGNPDSWLWQPRAEFEQRAILRAGRLLDAYLPLPRLGRSRSDAGCADLTDVRASRFLRPWSARLSALEPVKVRRICAELREAGRTGGIYHLWWHPHNFGREPARNLAGLAEILDTFAELSASHGMQSWTMAEAARSARLQ
jgi:peptidoglycan/xylan/chitin deacetylase (PgdA/CDA1 family)